MCCGAEGHSKSECPFDIGENPRKELKNKHFKNKFLFLKNNYESLSVQETNFKSADIKDEESKNCTRCGKIGHNSFDCNEIVCLRCGEFGHLILNCTNPQKTKTTILLEDWQDEKQNILLASVMDNVTLNKNKINETKETSVNSDQVINDGMKPNPNNNEGINFKHKSFVLNKILVNYRSELD